MPEDKDAEIARLRRKQRTFRDCLLDIARRMNRMADEIERDQRAEWHAETQPATLDDAEKRGDL
jgi:hypothetical protein